MGRPSKLTPERAERLLQAVRDGNTLKAACACAGVTEETLASWRRRFLDFSECLTRAIAESEASLVASIRQAGAADWRASAWLLERRWPDQWANRAKVDMNLRIQAAALAADLGLDPQQLIDEAERIATGRA
ncbi:MAG TPA: hypothetical protein VFB50_12400 [Chloroflexota bacterium]|nr:hypothetical protein [Chloroflexota bacterium]